MYSEYEILIISIFAEVIAKRSHSPGEEKYFLLGINLKCVIHELFSQ